MQRVNLLPHDVQSRIANRRLVPKLVLMQAAIFLCLWFVVSMVSRQEQYAWDDLRAANLELFNIRETPDAQALAGTLAMEVLRANMYDFIYMYAPTGFEPGWVDAIVDVAHGHMQELTYDGRGFVLRGTVDFHHEIDATRQALGDTGLFEYVGLGSTQILADGRVSYELRLVPYL